MKPECSGINLVGRDEGIESGAEKVSNKFAQSCKKADITAQYCKKAYGR